MNVLQRGDRLVVSELSRLGRSLGQIVAILDALAKARSSGRKLGRPKGSLGVSRLNGKEDDIRRFLKLGVSKTAIAKLTGVSRTTLYSFMRSRGLKPRREKAPILSGCESRPATVAPVGSNRSGWWR